MNYTSGNRRSVQLIEWTNEGPALVVNQKGEKILLNPNVSVVFDDFVGSRVCVKRTNGHVTCEATVPESTGLCRWTFDVGGTSTGPVESTIPFHDVKNLAALIAETRIEFSGRL